MIIVKLALFVIFFIIDSNAKLKLKTGGHWKEIFVNDVPEIDKELKFSQVTNLDEFNLKLIENPFTNIRSSQPEGNKTDHFIPFELMFIKFEFWTKFNVTLHPELILELYICEEKFNWTIRSIEKQVIFKKIDKQFIESKYKKGDETCLSDFKFSIINPINEFPITSGQQTEFKIEELNIIHLGVYYSSVEIDLPSTSARNEANIDEIWRRIELKYESTQESSSQPIDQPVKYECKWFDCASFLLNSKTIDTKMFYPRLNAEWDSFFESSKTGEIFSLELDRDIKLISNYTIEFLYFVTQNVKLQIYTSLNNNSIITLYPTYSYLAEKEVFKWLPVSINLKDLLAYKVNSVKSGFKVYIETSIQKNYYSPDQTFQSPNGSLQLAAITSIQLSSGNYVKQTLSDFLANWNQNGEKALNEWTCLIDHTTFYSGEQNDEFNNITVVFFTPKFKSKSTYLLLSKWFIATDQKFEIKIINELTSRLTIDTLNENLNVLNSNAFELDQQQENEISYDVLNESNRSILGRQVVRLRLTFKLKNYENEDQPKKIVIRSVSLADPCSDPNKCIFAKRCLSKSSTDFECECVDGYHGQRCEFPNVCAANSTEYYHCLSMNATCLPILDNYRCDCSTNEYWLEERQMCKKVPYCYTEPGLIGNQCVYDFTLDYDLNHNQSFACNQVFEIDSYIDRCPEFYICHIKSCRHVEERCIGTLLPKIPKSMVSICECELDYGFIRNETGQCSFMSSEQINNPFLKMLLGCSYDYTMQLTNNTVHHKQSRIPESFDHFEFKCACPYGFSSNTTNGLHCTPSKKCNLHCEKNQYCGFNKKNEATCLCKLGFSGPNCTENYCEKPENTQMIKIFCGDYGCKVTDDREFVCNCDERLYNLNNATGTCVMKEICGRNSSEFKICNKIGAVCMPKLKNSTVLDYECICPQGWQMNFLTNRCEELCEFYAFNELTHQRCFANLTLKEPKFMCKPGFYREGKICILSQMENKFELTFEARMNMDDDIDKKFNQIKNDRPNITNIDCSKYLDTVGCVRMLNRTYLLLEERSNSLLISQAYIYSFSSLLTISLQSSLGSDLFSSQILEFNKVNEELKRNEISSTVQERKSTADNSENGKLDAKKFYDNKQYFQVLNFTVYLETRGFFQKLDENFFTGKCNETFCPLYPYVHLKRGTLKVRRLLLNETESLTQCFPNSSPTFEASSNSLFRCTCDNGYKELARILMSSREEYFKSICYDEDECTTTKHNCDLNTTVCTNLPGHFKCDCKDNLMIKMNETHCKDFKKNQECDPETTDYYPIIGGYECRCKESAPIRLDEHNCYDPCAGVDCKGKTCIVYHNSTHCVDFNLTVQHQKYSPQEFYPSTSHQLSTAFFVWIVWLALILKSNHLI